LGDRTSGKDSGFGIVLKSIRVIVEGLFENLEPLRTARNARLDPFALFVMGCNW
jgi:hypothetical protein